MILHCTVTGPINIVGILAGRHGRRVVQVALDHGWRTGRARTVSIVKTGRGRTPSIVRTGRIRLIWKDGGPPTGSRPIPNFFGHSFISVTAFPQEVDNGEQNTGCSKDGCKNATSNDAATRTTDRSRGGG